MPVIACPSCRQPLSLDAAVLGQHVQCPACKQVFQTTVAPPAAPAVKKVVATPIAPPPQGVPQEPPPAFDPATAFAGLGQDETQPGDDGKRPGRRPAKKKSPLVPLLIGGFALLLLCCGGAGGVGYFAYKKANPPLVFTPFTAPDGTCSVLMPGPPTDDTPGADEGVVVAREFAYRHDKKDVRFELVYRDFPLTDADQARTAGEDIDKRLGKIVGAQGPAESKTPVKVGTLSGTDHVFKQNGKVVVVVRQLEAKGKTTGRKVLLIAEGTDAADEDRSKFLNSYKQLKPLK